MKLNTFRLQTTLILLIISSFPPKIQSFDLKLNNRKARNIIKFMKYVTWSAQNEEGRYSVPFPTSCSSLIPKKFSNFRTDEAN